MPTQCLLTARENFRVNEVIICVLTFKCVSNDLRALVSHQKFLFRSLLAGHKSGQWIVQRFIIGSSEKKPSHQPPGMFSKTGQEKLFSSYRPT